MGNLDYISKGEKELGDFKEWFREHEENKYSHDVQRCLNPNNCTINYIQDTVREYCNMRNFSNEDQTKLINYATEHSNDFSKITNTIWEKAYRGMQQEINEMLEYEKNIPLYSSYMRFIKHEMSENEIQQMLKHENVQKEWAPLLSNELDYMENNGQIEKAVMNVEKDITTIKEETGLIRFQNNAVFQFLKPCNKSENFQANFLYKQTKNSVMPNLFETIKASQESFSINMDVKDEEKKQLVARCSELENNLESLEDDISDLKEELESQIEKNQDLKEQLDIVLELTENPIKDIPNNDKINTLSGPVLEDDPFGLDEI